VSTWDSGDVFARAFVRWLEVQQSLRFVTEQLNALPSGEVAARVGGLAPNAIAGVVGRRVARRDLPRRADG